MVLKNLLDEKEVPLTPNALCKRIKFLAPLPGNRIAS